MILAVLEYTETSQRLSDATTQDTKTQKRLHLLAGPNFQISQCKNKIALYQIIFRLINSHSIVGLDNESMLLFGGEISGDLQTGIWQLKNDQWNKIGELATVYKFIK